MRFELEDKIISDFLRSIGPWRKCIIIGGGFALFIYKLYLADHKLPIHPVGTRDIDTLIPRKVPVLSTLNIAKHLQVAGFSHIFKGVDEPAAEAYVKKINDMEVEIEFLTDSSTRSNKNKNITIAGIVAQPLSYLTLSLQNSMKFQTTTNEEGFVVSPGAWIFHKGLTFTRRTSFSKKLKDLYGIWYVTTQLGTFSESSLEELSVLAKSHSKWFETLQKNMHTWVENASPQDWLRLESQDPTGKMKKYTFEKIIKKIHQC